MSIKSLSLKKLKISALRKKWRSILSITLAVLGGILIVSILKVESFQVILKTYEKFWLLICATIYPLLGLTFLPSEPLTLVIVAWKGPIIATVLATLGNTMAAVVEYYFGGSIGDLANFEKAKEKLPFGLGKLPFNSPKFLFIARLIPGFGAKFTSLYCGMLKVPMFDYLWTSMVPQLLGSSLLAFGGSEIIKLIK